MIKMSINFSEKSEKDFRESYPALYNHLLNHKEKLSARNKAETGIRYEWYALQRWAADYFQEFSKPKIMYPNMTKYLPFIYDETGWFGNDKTFIITVQDDSISLKSLVAILNSKLAKLWIRRHCPELGEDRREIRKVYFENFPVPAGIGGTAVATPAVATAGHDPLTLPGSETLQKTRLSELADKMLAHHAQLQ